MENNAKYILFIISLLYAIMVQGQVTWHETDWINNNYEYIENGDAEASPGEFILNNETSNMVFAFAPTQLAGVWDIKEFGGKLFLAACTLPMAVNGGEIYSYDFAANNVQYEYEVWEQGVIQMRIINNKLYIPGLDSQGSWDFGNIYIFDGNSWERKGTVPNALHVLDLIYFQDKMFVSTETATGENSFAKIYSSTNEGNSWTEVFSVSAEPNLTQTTTLPIYKETNNQLELLGSVSRRFHFMGIYNDTLYVQGDTRLPEGKAVFRSDGENWSTVTLDDLVFSYGTFQTYDNKFYFLNKNYLHIYNGKKWDSVALPFSGGVIARSLGYYNGYLFSGAENGILYKSQSGYNWTQESMFGQSSDEIESIGIFHGRLYVGTNGIQGKVFVSAAVSEGYLVSEKYDFGGQIKNGTINWNALTHTNNTSVKFQLKTANGKDQLDSAEFVGPDNSNQSYYETSGQIIGDHHAGDQWMQYKAYLTTKNNTLMPVLQEVRIAVDLNHNPEEYFLSGDIVYHTSGSPIPDVVLALSGDETHSTITNNSGHFEFPDFESGGSYTITPFKNGDISKSTILAYDASLAARIAIHIIPDATADQLIAADVDKDGSVYMYDASMIARYAVGLSPLSGTQVGSWTFAPKNRYYQHVSSNIRDADFTGIILGDVDGNWCPESDFNNKYLSSNTNESLFIKNGKIVLPILSEIDEKIFSFDINLKYNPQNLKFIGVKKTNLSKQFEIVFNNFEPGKLKVGGYSTLPIIKTGKYLEIEFNFIKDKGDDLKIELISYRINADPIKRRMVTLITKNVQFEKPGSCLLYQNFPNPFNSRTQIQFTLTVQSFVTINVYDKIGRAHV